jgi:hypothetical protein
MNWDFISQMTAFFIVTAVKTSNLTLHKPAGVFSAEAMFPVRYELGFISQKTAFVIEIGVFYAVHIEVAL